MHTRNLFALSCTDGETANVSLRIPEETCRKAHLSQFAIGRIAETGSTTVWVKRESAATDHYLPHCNLLTPLGFADRPRPKYQPDIRVP